MAIEKDLLDQLLAGRDPKDVFNKDGLVDELKKALSERILNAEIDEHLDGDGGEAKGNHRNGYSKKSVLRLQQLDYRFERERVQVCRQEMDSDRRKAKLSHFSTAAQSELFDTVLGESAFSSSFCSGVAGASILS